MTRDESQAPSETWDLPLVSGLGWKGLSDEDLKGLAQQTELEVEIPSSTSDPAPPP